MKLSALHLKHMVETDEDMERTLVTMSMQDLQSRYDELEVARVNAA